jgi:hypothetical protein
MGFIGPGAQTQFEGLRSDIWGEDDYSIIDGETRVGRITGR